MHAPDFSQQMSQMNKPTAAENAQHELGTKAQQDYMRDIIGTERNPGAAREYGDWIDYINNPKMVEFQKGQATGSSQMNFDGKGLLRSAAVGRTGGSGVAESGLRTGYSAFGSGLAGSVAGTGTQSLQEQNRARLGMAKIGQGMNDAVISGYQNLGAEQTQQRQTALYAAEEAAKRQMETQGGLMKLGAQVGGTLVGAASGAFNGAAGTTNAAGKQVTPETAGNFDWGSFGKNLGNGYTGGMFSGQGLYGAMR